MKYYHITKSDTNTIQSISMFGLECNKFGEIFLFENKSIVYNGIINTVSDCIAENQIFLNEYAMFEINPKGIKTELIPDNVGESSAKCQWYIKQKKFTLPTLNIGEHLKIPTNHFVFQINYQIILPQIPERSKSPIKTHCQLPLPKLKHLKKLGSFYNSLPIDTESYKH